MILLTRNYKGNLAGAIIQLRTSEEAALVAQGFATVSTGVPVGGAVTSNTDQGMAAIAAGASSVVITNSLVDATSKIYAVVAQAAADATCLRVERVVAAAGSFTVYGTANATADTVISWVIVNPSGLTASTH